MKSYGVRETVLRIAGVLATPTYDEPKCGPETWHGGSLSAHHAHYHTLYIDTI